MSAKTLAVGVQVVFHHNPSHDSRYAKPTRLRRRDWDNVRFHIKEIRESELVLELRGLDGRASNYSTLPAHPSEVEIWGAAWQAAGVVQQRRVGDR